MRPLAQATLAFAAGQLGLERVQVRRPEAAEAVEPGVHIAQSGGIDGVKAAGALGPSDGEARFAQDAQMGRHARLGDAELALDAGAHRP